MFLDDSRLWLHSMSSPGSTQKYQGELKPGLLEMKSPKKEMGRK
ncbi:hypothetical protein AVEN_113074-1, partial [Araneus ventricosus]